MARFNRPVLFIVSVMALVGLGFMWLAAERVRIFSWQASPIIRIEPASDESMHVEYPTVYRMGNSKGMLYSAYGDDGRWRIKLAVASTGQDFIKQGNIFDEAALPFKGGYAFPFVSVATVEGKTLFNLYFSAADGDRPDRYTAIYHSVSNNGTTWSAPERLVVDNALDPVVLTRNGKDMIVYTSVAEGVNVIRSAVLESAATAGKSQTVYSSASGFYTLGTLMVDQQPVLIVETAKDWMVMCFNGAGQLVPISKKPLVEFDKEKQGVWDSLKYGMHFFQQGSPANVYYNGITAHGAPMGGQVGVGTYDPELLADQLDTALCR